MRKKRTGGGATEKDKAVAWAQWENSLDKTAVPLLQCLGREGKPEGEKSGETKEGTETF